jgi:histidinol-phosphate aminotransferase
MPSNPLFNVNKKVTMAEKLNQERKTRPKVKNLADLCRQQIADLKPYVPGKPISLVKRELNLKRVIKLASNECPFGPFPKVLEAMRKAAAYVNRYPDGANTFLKEKLASCLGVSTTNLMIGHGSNELIRLIANILLNPGDEVIMAKPSFVVYPTVVKLMEAIPVEVPLTNHKHDLKAMLSKINSKTKLIFICNPNNPTGTIVTKREVEEFLKEVPDYVTIVFDEAYYELVESPEYPNGLNYFSDSRPIVVLRTFSKIYGLAGCRVGYGVAPTPFVEAVNKVREPFNVNTIGQIAAIFSLDCREELVERRRVITESKAYLYKSFDELGLTYIPSEANFILVKVGDGKKVADKLLQKGVIVRSGDIFGYPEYIRVTIGKPDENKLFIKNLDLILKETN